MNQNTPTQPVNRLYNRMHKRRHSGRNFLKQNRAEAKSVSIYEYDQEKHIRQEREASWEEGRESLLKELIQKKLAKGYSIPDIAEALEEEETLISKLIQEMQEA